MKKSIKTVLITIVAVAGLLFLYNQFAGSSVTGRIDMTTALVNPDQPQFEIYVDNSETAEKQAAWMLKKNWQGYVVQKDNGKVDITVKALADAEIQVNLRGKDLRDEDNKLIPVWVDFTSLSVNGEEVLAEVTPVWHNKPFGYTINAKNGEEYKIHAEWKQHKEDK